MIPVMTNSERKEIAAKYYTPIYEDKKTTEEEEYCLSEFLDGTIDFYVGIVAACKKLGIKYVYDIGCCYGHQSILFLKGGIGYTGIERCTYVWPRFTEAGARYELKHFPCDFLTYEAWENAAMVSSLCITFLQQDEQELRDQIIAMCKNAKYYIGTINNKYLGLIEEYYDTVSYNDDLYIGRRKNS